MRNRQLANGVEIPTIGLGVYRSPEGETTVNAVHWAVEAGYRHVDTAAIYGNEGSVGKAVSTAGVPREQIFVTTKLWRDDVGYDSALRAVDNSLSTLGLSYVDLYLIHWPTLDQRRDGWRAMERILDEGKARAIGVSNYMMHHLEEMVRYANVMPMVNQIELHPYNYRYLEPVVNWCREREIVIEAYSPLTKARKLDDPRLVAVAERYGKSTAQILIRFILQQGAVALPKSTNRGRIQENIDVFDFEISDEDMAELESFDEELITGWNPVNAP